MSIYEILILAIALSVDATVVSFSQGLVIKSDRIKQALKLAVAFAFFQAFMPLAGAFLTGFVYSYIETLGKFIVCAIFLLLGIKFIIEAFVKKEEKNEITCLGTLCVLTLAIATSIDAMGAGISLRLLNVKMFFPSLIIGIVTFVNSLLGFVSSSFFKKFNSKFIEIFGGVLLITLAVKAVV